MGHKTDGRRYRGTEPQAESEAAAAAATKISQRRARSIVARHQKQLDAGRRAYAKAGELLDQLVAGGLVGVEIKLVAGRPAVVVDQFAERNTVFKTTPMARYKLEVK